MAKFKYRPMDYGYLRIFVWTGFSMLGVALGGVFSYLFIMLVVLLAVLDPKIGRDTRNYPPEMSRQLSAIKFYRYLTFAQVPVQIVCMAFVIWRVTSTDVQLYEQIGMILSAGIVFGNIGINVAHEMIHKETRLEQTLGGLLLSTVGYSTFKIEHLYGHHVNVATPLDASTAPFGQSLYAFLPKAITRNVYNGFRLQNQRMRAQGLSPWSIKNELTWWTTLTAFWIACVWVAFGGQGVITYLLLSCVAIIVLEIVNYIDHYGLLRTQNEDGSYGPVTHHHSWNASDILSNYGLLNLQRHSDHHAFPRRRYQILRHYDDSPQLPSGYALMILMALVPPVWKRVMDPLAQQYRSEVLAVPGN